MGETEGALECCCNGNGCPSCDGSAERTYREHEERAGRGGWTCGRCGNAVAGTLTYCPVCGSAGPARLVLKHGEHWNLAEAVLFVAALQPNRIRGGVQPEPRRGRAMASPRLRLSRSTPACLLVGGAQ